MRRSLLLDLGSSCAGWCRLPAFAWWELGPSDQLPSGALAAGLGWFVSCSRAVHYRCPGQCSLAAVFRVTLHRCWPWANRMSGWWPQQGQSDFCPAWRPEHRRLRPVFVLPGEGAWAFAWVGAGNEPASPLSLGFAGSTLSYPIRPQANDRPSSLATLQVLLSLLLSPPRGMIDSGICTSLLRFINV